MLSSHSGEEGVSCFCFVGGGERRAADATLAALPMKGVAAPWFFLTRPVRATLFAIGALVLFFVREPVSGDPESSDIFEAPFSLLAGNIRCPMVTYTAVKEDILWIVPPGEVKQRNLAASQKRFISHQARPTPGSLTLAQVS